MDSFANLSMKEKLDLAILNDKRCKNKVLSVSKDFSKAIRKEIAVFRGIRGKYLQNCFDYLKNIKLTSVESERAFSASGTFVSKLRSSLEDILEKCSLFLAGSFQKGAKGTKRKQSLTLNCNGN
jgi:hypothetical protein